MEIFSALPAQKMGLTDRGVLKTGMWADVVVFDPETVHDVATYENPNQFSVGMDYVLVNGVPVIDDGKMTGARPAKFCSGQDTAAASSGRALLAKTWSFVTICGNADFRQRKTSIVPMSNCKRTRLRSLRKSRKLSSRTK